MKLDYILDYWNYWNLSKFNGIFLTDTGIYWNIGDLTPISKPKIYLILENLGYYLPF